MIVQCNNCMWEGEEEKLIIDTEDTEHCPTCQKTDGLMDLPEKNIPILIDKFISELTKDYYGYDTISDGKPAFEWSLTVDGKKYTVTFKD